MFDKKEWSELMMLADEIEPTTRMILCEFAQYFDSRGRAATKPKLVARTTGLAENDIRRHLLAARDAGWLRVIEIDGRKGFEAVTPF